MDFVCGGARFRSGQRRRPIVGHRPCRCPGLVRSSRREYRNLGRKDRRYLSFCLPGCSSGYRHWGQILGLGVLGAIGFTVSLFITGLAFNDPVLSDLSKIGGRSFPSL